MDNWLRKNKIVLGIFTFFVILWVVILCTETRFLVFEKKIEPGQNYSIEGYSNLGDSKQASLVCKYFTGRKFYTAVFWYSPDNTFGKDVCPFLYPN